MLAIFGFRKHRNQTSTIQAPEAEAEAYGDGGHAVATAPTGLVHAQKDTTSHGRHNAHDAPHVSFSSHILPQIHIFVSACRPSAALSSVNALTNITQNPPDLLVDTRRG